MAPPDDLFAYVGAAAQMLRKARGLTYEELESKSGVSDTTINRLEKGKSIGTEKLSAIMRALGVRDLLELADRQGEAAREELRKAERRPGYLADRPEALGANHPPVYLRLDIGDRDLLLTLTVTDPLQFRQKRLPLDED